MPTDPKTLAGTVRRSCCDGPQRHNDSGFSRATPARRWQAAMTGLLYIDINLIRGRCQFDRCMLLLIRRFATAASCCRLILATACKTRGNALTAINFSLSPPLYRSSFAIAPVTLCRATSWRMCCVSAARGRNRAAFQPCHVRGGEAMIRHGQVRPSPAKCGHVRSCPIMSAHVRQ